MCCEPIGFKESEIDGECPDCGTFTVDGEAFEQCAYSPILCKTCNWAPCDGSC
jgi:hypothetical protein